MPLPKPKHNEKYRQFTKRFLRSKEAKKEFPDIKQRFAMMASTWKEHKGSIPKTKQILKRYKPSKHNLALRELHDRIHDNEEGEYFCSKCGEKTYHTSKGNCTQCSR